MAKKILVVDDDEGIRNSTSGLLQVFGFEVVMAKNGKEALGLLSGVDLVLTDLEMPEMDGMALLRQVKDGSNPIPVIVMSGFEGEWVDEALAAGADGTILKPFDFDELKKKVKKPLCM